MYSKRNTERLVNRYAPIFIKKLRLNPIKIEFKIDRQEEGMPLFGYCQNGNIGKITIYYNNHNTYKQVLGTIFHELLHHKLYRLKRRYGAGATEEHFIRNIEEIYLEALHSNVLALYLNK